jgi:hypothetical protein
MSRGRGRGWAYTGAVLGAVVSVAANVAHSYVPPAGASDGWTPHAGAVLGAAFWPSALFVAIEILARTSWPDLTRWVLLRWLGLLLVAAVAAVVSYRHLSGLLRWYGEDRITYLIGPLAVDGLMVMATGALIATATITRPEESCSPAVSADAPSRIATATAAPAPTAVTGDDPWDASSTPSPPLHLTSAPHAGTRPAPMMRTAAASAGTSTNSATATVRPATAKRPNRASAPGGQPTGGPSADLDAARVAVTAIRGRGDAVTLDRLTAEMRRSRNVTSALLRALREQGEA